MMISIIPAAGQATRLHGLPKFLLPTPNGSFLLETLHNRMRAAGSDRTLIGANPDNAELLRQYKPDGATVYTVHSATMSETVLAARKYINDADVLFGMPDSFWTDDSVYQRLAADLAAGAMVSVALFWTWPNQHRSLGMCDVGFNDDDELAIIQVIDKPETTNLHYAWGAMAWRPDFWQFIDPADPHVGYALQRAIEARANVRGYLAIGLYWDCGTPEGYFACIRGDAPQRVGI